MNSDQASFWSHIYHRTPGRQRWEASHTRPDSCGIVWKGGSRGHNSYWSWTRTIGCLRCIVGNHRCGPKWKPLLSTSLRLANQIGQHPRQGVRRLRMILVRYRSKNSCAAMGIFPLSRRSIQKTWVGDYRGGFGGASLVHFPRRMSCRSFPGRTCFFPPKKPKMSAGRWWVWVWRTPCANFGEQRNSTKVGRWK